MKVQLLVTGGAGFIGGNFVRAQVETGRAMVNLDKLTYAGHLASLAGVDPHLHQFVQGDVCEFDLLQLLLTQYRPQAIVHLAAESHVDRSIDSPLGFVQTNLVGTATLLEAARQYWEMLPSDQAAAFRFLHVSTDEVFGSLDEVGAFNEATAYNPRSPYAATKAGADHLVRAYHATYGLPILITNCSNNYGPYQFPEKFIPLLTLNAIDGRPLPLYGDGLQVRDWLFVEDHCRALECVLSRGQVGQTYNIGGQCEKTNLDTARAICRAVQTLLPNLGHRCEDLITHVTDRPGHDRRYAIDASKIQRELGWQPTISFEDGIRRTVQWTIDNRDWFERITNGKYYGERLGLNTLPNSFGIK